MNKRKLFARIVANQKNVNYHDFITLLNAFGFSQRRNRGSHSIFKHKQVPINVNAQNENGEAKPYQIVQFLSLVEQYDLKMDGEEEEPKNE